MELAEFWPQWRYFGKVDDIFLKFKLRVILADSLEIFCNIAAKVGISRNLVAFRAPLHLADEDELFTLIITTKFLLLTESAVD